MEASIDGARGILLTIAGPSDLGLFEVNEAAEIIHGVAHPDANIIFGTVVDDEMGNDVRVTVIAAGFDRWDGERPKRKQSKSSITSSISEVFDSSSSIDSEDELDVPSFLK